MDECTPYLIPAPASVLINQTNDTHYASYHFQGKTDCTGEGRLLSYSEVGNCVNEDFGGSQLRVWVDAPRPPSSACTVPGVCGRGYQVCCIGSKFTGDECHCHLQNGTGVCGRGYQVCCIGSKFTGDE